MRPVARILFLFAVTFVPQFTFSTPLAPQSQKQLQLTIEIVGLQYCSVPAGTISLQLKLKARYTNLSSERLIIYQGHDLFYQFKIRSEAVAGTRPYEVLLLNMRYFDEEFELIEASSPGKVFVKLGPHESFERELITGIGITDEDKQRTSTSVKPGRHTLQVIVSTWYQSPKLAEKLRQQWQRKGLLWSQPLASDPIPLLIEKPTAVARCR